MAYIPSSHILRSCREVDPIRCGINYSKKEKFIRFTWNPRLIEKIREVSVSKFFSSDHTSEEAEVFYGSVLQLRGEFFVDDDPITGSSDLFCEMSAECAGIFFESVALLQKEDPKIAIPSDLFHKTIDILNVHSIDISNSEHQISCYIDLRKYKAEAMRKKDPDMALHIAQYYGRHNLEYKINYKCPKWIFRSIDYSKEKKESAKDYLRFFNFESFLRGLKITECPSEIFYKGNEEFADAFAKCPTIKKIDLADLVTIGSLREGLNCQYLTGLAQFLCKTQSVEEVKYNGLYKRVSSEAIRDFANALYHNTSVKRLTISSTKIPEEGIRIIANAILNNPNSGIIYLSFSSCDLTDKGASYLVELLRKKVQIRYLQISQGPLHKISDSIYNQIHEIISPRLDRSFAEMSASIISGS